MTISVDEHRNIENIIKMGLKDDDNFNLTYPNIEIDFGQEKTSSKIPKIISILQGFIKSNYKIKKIHYELNKIKIKIERIEMRNEARKLVRECLKNGMVKEAKQIINMLEGDEYDSAEMDYQNYLTKRDLQDNPEYDAYDDPEKDWTRCYTKWDDYAAMNYPDLSQEQVDDIFVWFRDEMEEELN